jgi:hypothetical protein
MVDTRPDGPKRLNEATLIALTGVSRRNLTRWRQQGLVLATEPRHGRGPGRGTTPLQYSDVEVSKINRLKELRREFKKVSERRWRLWLEGYPVRIAPDLADTLNWFSTLASKIRTLDDIETKISANLPKSTDLPRGNPLRVILRGLSRHDQRSLATMIFSVLLGIRLPLLHEANPSPFRTLKRALGSPKEMEIPTGLFDLFPAMHQQLLNALSKATTDELEGARAVCRILSRCVDNTEDWKRGGVAVRDLPLPRRPIELFSLLWPWPVTRAVTVGLIVFGMRGFKSALGEEGAAAVFAFLARDMSAL